MPSVNSSPAPPRRAAWLGVVPVLALLLALVVLSLGVGSRPISSGHALSVLVSPGQGVDSIIIWKLRMPRVLAALVAGAGFGTAGLVMQSLTRNPLAEPGILGVNAGASLAVVLAVAVFGVSSPSGYVWFSLVGTAVACALVVALGHRRGTTRTDPRVRLVLAGTALAACLGSVTGIVTLFSDQAFDSHRFWVVGSLAGRDYDVVAATAPFVLAGLVLALALAGPLNAMALGEDSAAALGVRTGLVRVLSLLDIALLAGGSTALAGPIGFLGLVAPHALRLLLGTDLRVLMPWSLLAGPCVLLAADLVGRVVARPGELEAGIVTAFVGAPVLLALALRRSR